MPGSESPYFVSTVLRDQAVGSAMHNAPVLEEERVGGHEHPSKFNAAVTSHWHWAHMPSEGNLIPNRKS